MPRKKKTSSIDPDNYDSYLDPRVDTIDYACDFEPTKDDLKNCEMSEKDIMKELDACEANYINNSTYFDSTEQQYFHSIAHFTSLSYAEEKELIRIMEYGHLAESIREKNGTKNEDILNHLQELIKEGKDAREKLINHNLKLAVSVAKHVKTVYASSKIDLMDLIQEGNAGLIHAVEKYDITKGAKFSTYATFWIRLYCNIAVTKQSRNIYLPSDIHNSIRKVRKAKDELSARFCHEPSIEDICNATKIPYQTVMMALRYEHDTVSYNSMPIISNTGNKQEDSGTFLDNITDGRNSTEEEVEHILLSEDLARAMKIYLTKREQLVLSMHYGLGNSNNMSLEDIGEMLGYTRQRISQIEMDALKKLRSVKHLKEYRDVSVSQKALKTITEESLKRSFEDPSTGKHIDLTSLFNKNKAATCHCEATAS